MGSRRMTFWERSEAGKCFTEGCSRKPFKKIRFNRREVWACRGCVSSDGLYC